MKTFVTDLAAALRERGNPRHMVAVAIVINCIVIVLSLLAMAVSIWFLLTPATHATTPTPTPTCSSYGCLTQSPYGCCENACPEPAVCPPGWKWDTP